MRKRTVVLLVLDGWGVGKPNSSNAIYKAEPKNINYIRLNYPAGTLQASGIAVGLPWSEPGSSEVGHMTLGAGKILYQDYPRISLTIRDKTFFKNEELLKAINHAKENGTKVNIVGLLGEGSGHSAREHLDALIELMGKEDVEFALHLFADGVDSSPRGAVNLIERIPQNKIASLSGRYFAMDSDIHWDRTKRCYEAIVGVTKPISADPDISGLLNSLYEGGATDEFLKPMLIKEDLKIKEGDGVIFFNFQEDGIRQLVEMFVDEEAAGRLNPAEGFFEVERHQIPGNLHIVTFTNYGDQFELPIAFPSEKVVNPLGKVLADTGKVQLRLAESIKYAHVTYFFNGMHEAPFKNEYRVVIPSREEAKVNEHPEMRTKELGARVLSAVGEGIYDFILVNFANADIMAHVGDFEAARKAINIIDAEVGALMKTVLGSDSILVITSDHGNAEMMLDVRTGLVHIGHTINPVPMYVVASGYERQKTEEQAREIEEVNTGVLSDVAPTILELMGIPKPEEMAGISLLKFLR